jgi:G:T/U-mismatch repair DNA glycosylase
MTENHPISNGFIPETARVLIIGTFPPKKEYTEKKNGFFFYSSEKNQFWNRIDNIKTDVHLKKTQYKNANESLIENKIRKESFSIKNKLGFIDVFSAIKRKADSANDSDLVPIENIIQNGKLIEILKSKNIIRICCTYKLAYECLKGNLGSLSKSVTISQRNDSGNGEIIQFSFENREIELILLYPATRSRHKGFVKDEQYKKYLFE